MATKAKYSSNQIQDIIAHKHRETGKILNSAELAGIIETSKQAASGHLTVYKKQIPVIYVTPRGELRTDDGELVWYRNTRGSLVVAKWNDDKNLGKFIDG